MKINDVRVTNWQPPGEDYWRKVQTQFDEPLIEATIKMTLNWREYNELIERDGKPPTGEKPA